MQTAVIIFFILAFIYFLLRELKHNKTEASFLSIVNHTFRTPLTRIKWQSDALKPDLSYEAQAEIARTISTTVNHVLEIIDTLSGIKDVHNSASYDLKAVSIREFIETGIGKYRTNITDKKLTFNLPTFNTMPLLTVDTKKISFVIEALLSNAIFYSKGGGIIDIRCIVKKRKLTLSIEDRGIGLSWKDKNNLYERFYRGNRALKMNTDGMGLSLYLSKEIIHRHHGAISVYSKGKDQGSTFSITLPIHTQ